MPHGQNQPRFYRMQITTRDSNHFHSLPFYANSVRSLAASASRCSTFRATILLNFPPLLPLFLSLLSILYIIFLFILPLSLLFNAPPTTFSMIKFNAQCAPRIFVISVVIKSTIFNLKNNCIRLYIIWFPFVEKEK